MAKAITSLYDEETDEYVKLLCRWEICGCCNGEGKSSRYLGAITQGDREPGGSWEDPDDFDDYMCGMYDKPCDECDGTGKVQVVDTNKLTASQLAEYGEVLADESEQRAAEKAERDFGA